MGIDTGLAVNMNTINIHKNDPHYTLVLPQAKNSIAARFSLPRDVITSNINTNITISITISISITSSNININIDNSSNSNNSNINNSKVKSTSGFDHDERQPCIFRYLGGWRWRCSFGNDYYYCYC